MESGFGQRRFAPASPTAAARNLSLASGARVAGAALCIACITGISGGSVFHLIGGFSLIGWGNALSEGQSGIHARSVSLGVLFAGLVAGAFRWQTFELASIRGAQGALGPGVLVGPTDVGLASVLAAGGCIAALMAWRAAIERPALWSWPELTELGLLAAGVATIFFGPSVRGRGAGAGLWLADIAMWVVPIVLIALTATGGGWATRRSGPLGRWLVIGTAAIAVGVGAILIAGAL